MSNRQLRIKLDSRQRRFAIYLAILILAAVSLIMNLSLVRRQAKDMFEGPENVRAEILKRQEKLIAVAAEERQLQIPIQQLSKSKTMYWIARQDNFQMDFRRKIEQNAKAANLKLKTIGTIQSAKIADGVTEYEINLTADVKVVELLNFVQKMEQERPQIFWKNITVTPDNMSAPNFLMLNGTLKIVVVSDPEIITKIWNES